MTFLETTAAVFLGYGLAMVVLAVGSSWLSGFLRRREQKRKEAYLSEILTKIEGRSKVETDKREEA